MKHYEIQFPVNISLVVEFEGDEITFLRSLSDALGIVAYSGSIYNPKMYMSFKEKEIIKGREVPLARLIM